MLVALEHRIFSQCLRNFLLQFDRRELQQSYGLLQLRGHCQVLRALELQAGLHAVPIRCAAVCFYELQAEVFTQINLTNGFVIDDLIGAAGC